jgi:hypothetical protein
MTATGAPRPILASLLAACLALGACGSPGRNIPVDVSAAPRIPAEVRMGEEVGRLLSPEPAVSKAAERRLMALDEDGRDRLVAYAATLAGERDVRLLHVLDEHHALPAMPVGETLDFLLWKAARPERFYVMKAQSRMLDLARREPDAFLGRARRGGPGFRMIAVVLASNDIKEAIPVLAERYRRTGDAGEREAAALALARLTGGAVEPRPAGPRSEIERDAAAVGEWYRDLLEQEADEPSGAEEGDR